MTRRHAAAVAAALLLTLALGLSLRWALAGAPVLPGGFTRWRMVHSHLGYYAVLLPLAWPVWAARGGRGPGGLARWAYAATVLLAMVGFAVDGGYGPLAMAGSTGVLALWLADAWRNRRRDLLARDWLGPTPTALVMAALCVPPVGVLSARDPALARQVLSTFLTLLLVGVLVPAALSAVRAAAPRGALWLLSTLGAALWLGPLPGPITGLGAVLLAVTVLRIALRPELPLDRRLGWAGFSAGLLAMVLGLVPNHGPVAIGAVHYLVLGPLLDGLTASRWPTRPSLRWATLAAAAAMSAALVAQGTWATPGAATAAAWAGTAAALGWAWRIVAVWGNAPSSAVR